MKRLSDKRDGSKTIVVMPAYNAEKTLKKTYNDIPKKAVDEIILVDDGSNDKTVQTAKKLRIKTYVHPQNRGYGGNQKTCYTLALNEGAKIVIMIHPDYQYDSTLTEELIRPIKEGRFDIMLGSRIRTRREALEGGMPAYKYIGNRFLTILQNVILGQNLSEYHTGFRAFHRKVLKKLPFHKFSDDFVFDQEILVSAIRDGYKVGETPVPVRYTADASSINFKRSVIYGLSTTIVLFLYLLDTLGIYTARMFTVKK
jgi:glycosyltransferase involved in cell wall biosynthesis